MSKYKSFIFKDYVFDKATKELQLTYSYDNELDFCEKYIFDFDFTAYDETALERALQLVFFMAGVSYYKMYLAPEIVVLKGDIDQALATFLKQTFENGLREFFYVNNLDLSQEINFPANCDNLTQLNITGNGNLIGIGGGKDSLVSVELLSNQGELATWSLNHKPQLTPLIERVGLKHFWVERVIDPKILELNKADALNGHVPISAIISSVGVAVAVLSGHKEVIVSNESSANEPTLVVNGIDVNHQYSKSLNFEKNLQDYLKHIFNSGINYYSLLRPFSEMRIAEFFSKLGFSKYKEVFSSCNRAFRHGENHLFWCGECPKCAFVFLILTPFISRVELESLWHGKNLLLDPSLDKTYRQLLGIEGDKPLDCIGEVKESRSAMKLAQQIYPVLNKYVFDIPEDYDYKTLSPHSMPADIYKLVISETDKL